MTMHPFALLVSRQFRFAGVLIGLAALPVKADLDLSPELVTYELDGVSISQLAFGKGTKEEVTCDIPNDWKYSGSRNQLELQPPRLSQTSIKITQQPRGSAIVLDAAGQILLKEKAIASLPEGSQQIKVENEELNPLQIEGKQTYLVELSYVSFGEKFATYQLYLDRNPQPIVFRLSCPQKDYPELRQTFHKSLFSWQNL